MRRDLVLGALLFVVCLGVFSSVYHADFVHWDDDLNITGNPHIQKLNGENLEWMFTDISHMRRYVPMSWLTWAVTYHFFGLNPRAFHLEGLLLHAINAVLLFFLIKNLLKRSSSEQNETRATIGAAAGALIWAVHPLRVEVVAWANCQMYAQSLLFLLLSIFAYLRAITSPQYNRLLWTSVILFTCSLLTYPTAIGFVAVLLLLDIFVLRRLPADPRRWFAEAKPVLIEKVPFVMATLAVAGVTLWARMHMSGHWKALDHLDTFSWPSRIAQAFYIWAYYLWKPWFSFQWSPVYTQLVTFTPTAWPFVVSGVTVLGISAFLFANRRRWPGLLVLWICHLVLLVPMLGLTEHPHYPNDRYNYLAAITASVLIAFSVARLRQWKVVSAIAILAALVFSVFSFQQTTTWRNTTVLYQTVLQKLGNNPYSADIYWRLGMYNADQHLFAEALDSYDKSLAVAPESAKVRVSKAAVLIAQKKPVEAIAEYERALKSEPKNATAHYGLGVLLDQRNDLTNAIAHYRAAVAAEPNNAEAHNNLATDLAKSGLITEALSELQAALKLDPQHPYANFNMGNALMQQNKLEEAITCFMRTVQSKPDFADAHLLLGNCLAMSRRVSDAIPHFAEAARLKPESVQAFFALGMALSQIARFNDAITAYREAIRIDPDFLRATINLGWIFASHHDANLRNGPEALKLALHAVALTEEKDAETLDLLAAAYAECAKFPDATATVGKAISKARSLAQQTQLQARLELYRAERPLRQ